MGGASGIGSKIGGGVAAFGTSLSESLNPLQNVFAQQKQQDPIYERYLAGERTANTLPFDENPSFIIKKDEPEKNDNVEDSGFGFNSIIDSITNFGQTPSAFGSTYQGNFFGGSNTIVDDRSSLFPSAGRATNDQVSMLRNLGIGTAVPSGRGGVING
ncbi:MAG: hypothetical protein HOB54_06865 [Flavobacteriales bacterium]|nr:hypothetical protein [Flavobacteriales bacterium]